MVVTRGIFDAFIEVSHHLCERPPVNTRLGPYHEIINFHLTIRNPRDRVLVLVNDPIYHERYLAAQWVWYAKQEQTAWIKKYHPLAWSRLNDSSTDINSNYGQYVWKEGQFNHCLELLRSDPDSRRAVIMFNRHEVATSQTQDHICTTSLQFLIRDGRLHLITTMRSNELLFGFRTDLVFFTLLQEIMAVELNTPLGDYHHNVGSFHVAVDKVLTLKNDLSSPYWRQACPVWPAYTRGELPNLLDPDLKGEFSLTRHFKKLMALYEPSANARA